MILAKTPICSQKRIASFVKAEKVVKEPRNPIPKKNCKCFEKLRLSFIKKPMKKQPNILIINVPEANPRIEQLLKRLVKKNLDPAPRPPPTNIKK